MPPPPRGRERRARPPGFPLREHRPRQGKTTDQQGGTTVNDRTWDRLSGLLIGAAAGFLAGILLAPTAGEETRNTVVQRTRGSFNQLRSSVLDMGQAVAKRGRSLINGVTEIEVRDQETEPAPGGEPSA